MSTQNIVELKTVNDRAREKLRRDMGEVLERALLDPKTIEIMLNADGTLWQECLGEPMHAIGTLSSARAESIIKTIAGFHHQEVTRFKPLIEGELPLDGSRFAGQLPPVVKAPTFAIRKKASSIFTLSKYVDAGVMTARQCEILQAMVANRRNILVIGGTGSGKTTLVNAIIHEMVVCDPKARLLIIEDLGEIQCFAENVIQFHTSIEINMTQLLKTALRMRPDRILVGEVRGAEALDLLDAWNTGHEGGCATLHANHPEAGLMRLKSLMTRNPCAPSFIEPLIGEAVHCVVHIAKTPQGRRISSMLEVHGFANGTYQTTLCA